MKIAIAGTGYVGLSSAVLLELEDYLTHKPLKLKATLGKQETPPLPILKPMSMLGPRRAGRNSSKSGIAPKFL